MAFATSLAALSPCTNSAQTTVTISNMFGVPVFVTNTVIRNPNTGTALTPSLANSNATPAIGQQSVAPAIAAPPSPAIIQQSPGAAIPPQPFTPAIGRQDTTAIGQQGAGTAIGQQGATAIGQQGVGTAIIPETSPIVIGQPEPFNPAPTPAQLPPTGFGSNIQNHFGQSTVPLPGRTLTNAPVTPQSSPTLPSTTPRRR